MARKIIIDTDPGINGINGIYVHDSSAIAYLLAPELFTTTSWPIRVDTTQALGRGKTWPALGNTDQLEGDPWRNRPLVTVCVDVDGPAVVRLLLDTMRSWSAGTHTR